jgi:hypothetical protein
MGVRWDFAADGSDIPGTADADLANVQASLVVVSYAPAGSTPVYADFETGTNADALAGNYPYQNVDEEPEPIDAATQIMLFKMQGAHNGNATGGHDKVILNKGTFLGTGTVLDFFYKTKGAVSCRVFDSTAGGAQELCTQSSDGLHRACDCRPGWYTSTATEKCTNRCKFGTWGPGCIYKMDGTSTPDPDTGLVPDLCDQTTLSDTIIESLMTYDDEHGLPARCAGTTTIAEFRTALNPPRGSNTTCSVINAGPGDALDIQYDCLGEGAMDGPNTDGTQVSAQWQKGTDQNAADETTAAGWVVHDNEGQCLMEVNGDKVLCQLGGNGETIREDNGYSATDCTMENTGNMGTCDGAMASTSEQCTTAGGTWTDGDRDKCKWEEVNVKTQCPANNAGLDSLFSERNVRAECRLMQCNRTNCGKTNATPDSWHVRTKTETTSDGQSYTQLDGCVKNTKGGTSGNYACPQGPDPPAPEFHRPTVAEMIWQAPSQTADGKCRSVQYCDNCSILDNDDCGGSTAIPMIEGSCSALTGNRQTCLYNAATATGCK